MGTTQRQLVYRSISLLSPSQRTSNRPLTVAIIGIGGRGGSRIARYYKKIGVSVFGFDSNPSESTKRIEQKGITVFYKNPAEKIDADVLIYSFSLPQSIRDTIQALNPDIPFLEIGALLAQLGKMAASEELTEQEMRAIKSAEIAPLLSIDFSAATFIGVTGTDGKTTTCLLLHHILNKMGFKTGVISTVGNKIGNRPIFSDEHSTTPSAEILAKMIKHMLKAKCTHIIIETSSQALASERTVGIQFDAVTITNITSDHLDYHKTYENYLETKKTIVTERLKPSGTVVLNKDDASFSALTGLAPHELTYSVDLHPHATLLATNYRFRKSNSQFDYRLIDNDKHSTTIKTKLPGKYNVSNVLGVLGVLMAINVNPLSKATAPIETFSGAQGRMKIIQKKPLTILVDYAHTVNALKQVLITSQHFLRNKNSKIIAIVGSTGCRDKTKRIPMGEIAKELADITIIAPTSPYYEKQADINQGIHTGWLNKICDKVRDVYVYDELELPSDNRRMAFKKAIALAKPGDVILANDFGHETEMIFNGKKIDWSDIEEFRKLIGKKGK